MGKIKLGINGLGRIGRLVIKALSTTTLKDYMEIVMLNGSVTAKQHSHMLKYDSVHGKYDGVEIAKESDTFICIDGRNIPLSCQKIPKDIHWDKFAVDVVLECTGAYNTNALASQHLGGSVKKVIVSCPMQDADANIVYGVNDNILQPEHKIISATSCTTNCLAPVAKILHDALNIHTGYVTTVHAYTSDQMLVDSNHKDLRRARAATLSIIPTTTGAVKSIGNIIPDLAGKLDGTAIRVPVADVSMIDMKCTVAKSTNKEDLLNIFREAEKLNPNILGVCDEPLVSIDFVGDPRSAIIDVDGLYVSKDGNFIRVMAWYDNEWAFAIRMLELALLISTKYVFL